MTSRTQKIIREQLWYVNAGILSDENFERAKLFTAEYHLTVEQTNVALFLAIEYLIQYFELVSINYTNLINECIERQLLFCENMVGVSNTGQLHISAQYFNVIYSVFETFKTSDDLVQRQFCIDALERICKFFETRTQFWLTNKNILHSVQSYGRVKRDCVIYNSFLIPNFLKYRTPLLLAEEKLFYRIQIECNCRIKLQVDYESCKNGGSFMLLEVVFDWYKGNFLGFLDNLSYIVKYLSPKKHFVKSHRTVVRTKDMYLSILSDLPLKELWMLEKDIRAGNSIAPFLGPNVTSKKLFKLYLPDIKAAINKELKLFIKDNEELTYWQNNLSKKDYKSYIDSIKQFISNYQCYMVLSRDWKDFKRIEDLKPAKEMTFGISQLNLQSTVAQSEEEKAVEKVEQFVGEEVERTNTDEEGEVKEENPDTTTGETQMKEDATDTATKETDDKEGEKLESTIDENQNGGIKEAKADQSQNDSDNECENDKECEVDNMNNSTKISKIKRKSTKKYDGNNSQSRTKDMSRSKKALIYKNIRKINKRYRNSCKRNKNTSNIMSIDESIKKSNSKLDNVKVSLSIDIPYGRPMTKLFNDYQSKLTVKELKITKLDSLDDNLKIFELFKWLYHRRSLIMDEPNRIINHTLRVILRCNTDYNAGDEIISQLDQHPFTIHDLLKKYYNFDLKHRNFFTKRERQMSYITKEMFKKEKRKRDEELAKQKYAQFRRIVTDDMKPIDSTTDDDVTANKNDTEATGVTEASPDSPSDDTDENAEMMEQFMLDGDELFSNFKEKKEKFSVDFSRNIKSTFGDIDGDTLQLFNEKKMMGSPAWQYFMDNAETIRNLLPLTFSQLQCDAGETFKSQVNHDQLEMLTKSVITNVYVTLHALGKKDPKIEREFYKLMQGVGMNLKFLNEIKKINSVNPTFFGYLNGKNQSFCSDLNHCLCVCSFDIYLICASLNTHVAEIFEKHKQQLFNCISKQPEEIRNIFVLFDIQERIQEMEALVNVRLASRSIEEINVILKLSLDFKRLSNLIYRHNCCLWRRQKSIRILYVSMVISGNRKCQEPFVRSIGDRRVKKIETKSQSLISMHLVTHPQTGVQFPCVEVFYDFFKGNHFCCLDLIKSMLTENRNSTVRLIHSKHLVCLPYGELWILPDVDWLRSRGSYMWGQ